MVSSHQMFCEPHRYYSAYVDFFTVILHTHGAAATLEDYVFSQKANFDLARDADGNLLPQFICRFIDEVLHPLIHVGYGLEFGLPGILAEGALTS
jgi:Questin oxidase-like